jgi:ParB family transcriptional regulator, chromosome partitioning protein
VADRGMGKGLGAILSRAGGATDSDELREIAPDLIVPNPDQPRTQFDERALERLAESIRARGVLQPVLVTARAGGTYELIAGERRWRAAQAAGLETIPAVVRASGDAASLELALIENMAREDLNPVETARACAALVEDLGLTREEVGLRIGRGRVSVSNLLRLLELPDDALDMLEAGDLTEGHGRALLLCPDHDERRRLAAAARDGGWSVRQLEERAREAADPSTVKVRSQRLELHPDEAAAIQEIADALGEALGADVQVSAVSDGYRAVMRFESAREAVALAERLRARMAA